MPVNRGKRAWRAPTPHLLITLRSHERDTLIAVIAIGPQVYTCGFFVLKSGVSGNKQALSRQCDEIMSEGRATSPDMV